MQDIICLSVERLPLTNLLGGNLKLFLIHRDIAHSTPLPMGEGSGGGASCFFFTRVKNLDISFNKILEIKVKNTYCE